jgi:hypothetical protein
MSQPSVVKDRQSMPTEERLDAHNAAVSILAVRAHRCGVIDLRTGRTCPLPEHHSSSCRFVADQQLTPAPLSAPQ